MSARTGDNFGARSFGQLLNGIIPNKDPDREKKPHRWSYDIDDRRAQVFRPFGNGTVEEKRLWKGALLRVFDETLLEQRKNQYRGPHRLQDGDRRVLAYMLDKLNAVTGQLDPKLLTIAEHAGVSLSTAKRAIMRLAHFCGLRWVRRTREADTKGAWGPQQVQTSHGYWFDIATMPKRVFQHLRDKLRSEAHRRGQPVPDVANRAVKPKGWRRDDFAIWSPIVRARKEAADRRAKKLAELNHPKDKQLNQLLNSIGQGPFVEDSESVKRDIYPEGKIK